jgi:hypothetical protein
VITNQGEQHITGSTPSNHYSLLLSMEDAFGLPCLQHACDAATSVKPMTKLFDTQNAQEPRLNGAGFAAHDVVKPAPHRTAEPPVGSRRKGTGYSSMSRPRRPGQHA